MAASGHNEGTWGTVGAFPGRCEERIHDLPGTGLLQDEVPHQFGIDGMLEEQQHVMTRMREEVSTRMPRPEESVRLRLGVPVLDVWHTSIDQGGEPYELTRFVMRVDMTGLLYDVPVE
jgi:GntR family transcriptional regulator